MNHAWITNRNKARRRQQRQEERPVLQLPVARPVPTVQQKEPDSEPEVERGVAVIDFYL